VIECDLDMIQTCNHLLRSVSATLPLEYLSSLSLDKGIRRFHCVPGTCIQETDGPLIILTMYSTEQTLSIRIFLMRILFSSQIQINVILSTINCYLISPRTRQADMMVSHTKKGELSPSTSGPDTWGPIHDLQD
jgi:hypothetical protein